MSTQRDPSLLQTLARRFAKPTPISVIVIEPDVINAQRLHGALRSTHSVRSFTTGRAAIASLADQVPTLLVTEFDLPDMSGLDVLKIVHSTPTFRHVLLMVITSRRSVQDKIAAFQAGADDYLVKPIDDQFFAEHIERLSRFRQVIVPEG